MGLNLLLGLGASLKRAVQKMAGLAEGGAANPAGSSVSQRGRNETAIISLRGEEKKTLELKWISHAIKVSVIEL